jgi:hypothetical protein
MPLAIENPPWMQPQGGIGAPMQGLVEVDPYRYESASAPQWNAAPASPQRPPTNGMAIAGFILSFFWLFIPIISALLSIIFSILGVRKATRLAKTGQYPVGRVLARWGLGLGIASMVLSIVWFVSGVLVYAMQQQALSYYENQPTSTSDVSTGGDSETARALEADIANVIETLEDIDVTLVTCPDTVSAAPGNVVLCSIERSDGRAETATVTYTDAGPDYQFAFNE